MPHLGEFTKKTHADLTDQDDLHTPKLHASRHEGGADPLTLKSIDSLACKIKTGTYTGDGTTSQAISGLGFQPKAVWTWRKPATSGIAETHIKTDQMGAALCFRHAAGGVPYVEVTDSIISIDSDGFTVDDQGVDKDPNRANTTYSYLALA